MDENTARKAINKLLVEARDKINEAVELSKQTGVSFYWDGFTDHDGAEYIPAPVQMTRAQAIEKIASGVTLSDAERAEVVEALNGDWSESTDEGDYGWVSSSDNC